MIKNGTTKHVATIGPNDVGRQSVSSRCECCGHTEQYWTHGAIGLIQPGDVGKRVYTVMTASGTIIQVENNEQRDARLA